MQSNQSSRHFNLRLPLAFTDALRAGPSGSSLTRTLDSTLRRYAWLIEDRQRALHSNPLLNSSNLIPDLQQLLSHVDARSSSVDEISRLVHRRALELGFGPIDNELDVIAILELAERGVNWAKLVEWAPQAAPASNEPLTADS